MSPRDRDALKRAIEMAGTGTLDPIVAEAVERLSKSETLDEVGRYAAYHLQVKSLRLRPWQAPPCDANDEIDPAEGDRPGNMPGEVGLRQRLKRAGLSVFEPDVLGALEAAEADPLPAA